MTGGADVGHLSYAYDANDNIMAITDLVNAANSRSFGYDSVDRLTRANGGLGSNHRGVPATIPKPTINRKFLHTLANPER
jgi:hypothetical protein